MNPTTAQPIRPLAKGSLRLQSDGRLVKLFRRGVDPAFDELVRRHRGALVGYAGAIAGRDRAEDVVQESLLKAHRSLNGDQVIDPKPWLYKIVRNTALNDIRDNRKHRHDDLGEPMSIGQSPHDVVEQRERLAIVVAAVADLPASQRRALIGHELGGFTHEQIANELDLSTGATKNLIYRARLTLRNAAGALIPLPVISWLAADSAGTFAGGVATGGAIGAAATSGGGSGGAAAGGAGGLLASLGGGGAAKIAVVAVVAGGSFTAGMATEKRVEKPPIVSTEVAEAQAEGVSGGGGPSDLPPVISASALVDGTQRSPDSSKGRSDQGSNRGQESGDSSGKEGHEGSGRGEHRDDPRRPPASSDDGGHGRDGRHTGSEDHRGSGEDGFDHGPRPAGADGGDWHHGGSGGSDGDRSGPSSDGGERGGSDGYGGYGGSGGTGGSGGYGGTGDSGGSGGGEYGGDRSGSSGSGGSGGSGGGATSPPPAAPPQQDSSDSVPDATTD